MLIEYGYIKIGFVGNIYVISSIQDRFLGFYKVFLENKIDFNKDWIIKDRDDNNNFIDIVLFKNFLMVFVCNCDKIVYFIIEKFKLSGYKVLDDVLVVGFDDSFYVVFLQFKIIIVCVNLEEMGRRIVKMMVEKIK